MRRFKLTRAKIASSRPKLKVEQTEGAPITSEVDLIEEDELDKALARIVLLEQTLEDRVQPERNNPA